MVLVVTDTSSAWADPLMRTSHGLLLFPGYPGLINMLPNLAMAEPFASSCNLSVNNLLSTQQDTRQHALMSSGLTGMVVSAKVTARLGRPPLPPRAARPCGTAAPQHHSPAPRTMQVCTCTKRPTPGPSRWQWSAASALVALQTLPAHAGPLISATAAADFDTGRSVLLAAALVLGAIGTVKWQLERHHNGCAMQRADVSKAHSTAVWGLDGGCALAVGVLRPCDS
jgi:hypothetical protein